VVTSWSGGATALRLAATALETSTSRSYKQKWALFCEWCRTANLQPLPATSTMVFAYIGWLAERGTIAANSLQPYLSAINGVHADMGLDRPAIGHVVLRARQGLERGQTLCRTRDTRVPLPATAVLNILEETLARESAHRSSHSLRQHASWLRDRYALCLAFVFMARQDSCISLHTSDHGFTNSHLWLRIAEKMRKRGVFRRVIRLPLLSPPVHGHASALPHLAQLGKLYVLARDSLGPAPMRFFQLPQEPVPTASLMSSWVARVLDAHSIVAPSGFAYLGHSLRSGGASAAEAIGVSSFRANWLGGWSQTSKTRELHYVDPSLTPSPAAYSLLGWLLAASFDTDVADPGSHTH